MHREFCTLCDSNYLLKALALYASLVRHCPSFHLTAFCFDDDAERLFGLLKLPNLSTVSLTELEASDAGLLSAKGTRTREEYCWTATPALPLYLFESRPELHEVTYLDADLLFFDDPEPLYAEMGDASVLVTPHRFAPEYKHHVENGIYNVQFLPFRRDQRGLACLQWWHDRCVEWCYRTPDAGRFGDQKYLDQWPDLFEGVHICGHKGAGLAPWNVPQYSIRQENSIVLVDEDPLIFYHFYQVRMREGGSADIEVPWYPIPRRVKRLIYRPYLHEVANAKSRVRAVEPGFSAGVAPRRLIPSVMPKVWRTLFLLVRRLPAPIRAWLRTVRDR